MKSLIVILLCILAAASGHATEVSVSNFYDLDPLMNETRDLSTEQPEVAERMQGQLLEWNATMDASFAGKDYPEGRVSPPDSASVSWFETPAYQPYLAQWKERWEYKGYLQRAQGDAKKGGRKKQQ